MSIGGRQVHLGAGAFARAHTWSCTAGANAHAAADWDVFAVAQRSTDVIDRLRRSEWRYTVVEQDENGATARRIDAVADGLVARDQPDRLRSALADPRTHVVTITATEAAYPRDAYGRLDRHAVREDLDDGGARTLVAQVVLAARERARAEVGGLSFLVCDNISRGGEVLRTLALEFAQLRSDDLAAQWLTDHATFPHTVVDRIVPAPTDDVRRAAFAQTGADDPALVVTEPFFRWVMENRFAAARPPWERAGALIVDDVAPWQAVKLHLVNAPHSYLAYLGLLDGIRTTHAAHEDPVLRRGLEAAYVADLIPAVPLSADIDPEAEAHTAARRFGNPRIAHELAQIGAGGAAKLAQRLAEPLRVAQRAGRRAPWLALILSAWAECVAQGVVDDPSQRLANASALDGRSVLDAAGLGEIADDSFATTITECRAELRARGARHTVQWLIDQRGADE